MKKQTQLLTTTLTRSGRLQLIFLIVIATLFYRNYSNRRLPAMPPNTLTNLFNTISGESFHTIFQYGAIAALLVLLVAGVIYIIRTH